MADQTTFVKIDRNMLHWRWFRSSKTVHLFLYLILRANVKDADFETITVHRGQLVASYSSLSKSLGMTEKSVRVALEHLKATGEVAISSWPKYSVITVLNYDKYQSKGQTERQADGKLTAGEGQQSKNIKNVRMKEEKESTSFNRNPDDPINQFRRWPDE